MLIAPVNAVTVSGGARAALDRWAAHLARYHPRLLAVDRAVQRVWRKDPDAAAHRERVTAEKLANCRRLVRRLDEEGVPAPAWTADTAADLLFALVSSDLVEARVRREA